LIPLRQLIESYIGGGWGKDSPDKDHTVPAYVIRGTDLIDVQSRVVSRVPFRFHKASNARSRALRTGDIVFEVSGGSKDQPVGRSLLIDQRCVTLFDGNVIPASFCKKISPDQEKIHPRYLLAHLQLAWSDRRIVQWQVQSTGISNFNFESFLDEFFIELPARSVQDRIAEILTAYDDLIENSQRRIRILEEMARALYREWFVHFRFPGFDSAAEASRAPSSWKHTALKDVAEVRLGKMLDQSKNRGELMPYLANVNVRWGEFDVSALRMMRFEEHECEAYGLRVGDIVMCEGGEPGRCAIWRNQVDGVMIQKALHRIRCRAGMSFVYLYHCLRQLGENGFLSSLFTGSTIKHLPLEKLANVRLMVPHADLLAQFENVAGPIESQIFSLQCQIQVLRRNRDLLLPRLLSGQIDVEALT